jgi:hypothetical protein
MKFFSIFQILLGGLLILLSTVAAERGYLVMSLVMAAGLLPLLGGTGILKKKNWGWLVSLIANVILLVPILGLSWASWETAGAYTLLVALVPGISVFYLIWSRQRSPRPEGSPHF